MSEPSPTPSDSMPALYKAVERVANSVRTIFGDRGRAVLDMRLPVLFKGTDMRVTIEVGPGVAARNAIEYARMQSTGGTPPQDQRGDAIREAAALISQYASEVKAASSSQTGWDSEEDESLFNRCADAIAALEAIETQSAAH